MRLTSGYQATHLDSPKSSKYVAAIYQVRGTPGWPIPALVTLWSH